MSEEAHKNGLKFLLWFDPEVAGPGTETAKKHPEWIIRESENSNGLYNLGNPDALKYMTDLISGNLIKWDVDIMRNDYNTDPASYWKMADEPSRTGITEIRYVEGLYKFWDALLKRKPDLLIDNCASGGKRIDYETCKRSVPLWRSDYQCFRFPDLMEASQNQTYGLCHYLPYNSTGQGLSFNPYDERSLSSTSRVFSIHPPSFEALQAFPFDKAKKVWDDIKSYNYLMAGDYYPLTDFGQGDNVWMAWQFDCPEIEEGCVICFRRKDAPYPMAEFKLHGINPDAQYKLTDIDTHSDKIVSGKELEKLLVELEPLTSKVLKYKKQ